MIEGNLRFKDLFCTPRVTEIGLAAPHANADTRQLRNAQRRALKLGRTLGDDREVLDGLAGGDTVVVGPPDDLIDGARVRVARNDDNDVGNTADQK